MTTIKKMAAICYCTDYSFLVPSIVSALSISKQTDTRGFDFLVFTIGIEQADLDRLDLLYPMITFIPIGRDWEGHIDISNYKDNVPILTLGRLFIHNYFRHSYERILYIDGDTYVYGDLRPLLLASLPVGCIGAVDDSVAFSRLTPGPYGKFVRHYLKSLYLGSNDVAYFNAGVILADCDTWKAICVDAFIFFRDNMAICVHHDQSALNAVARNRRIKISLRWNAISAFTDRGLATVVKPNIRHYTGSPKPWQNVAQDEYNDYQRDFLDTERFISQAIILPELDDPKSFIAKSPTLRSHIFRFIMRPVWRYRFIAYEKSCIF